MRVTAEMVGAALRACAAVTAETRSGRRPEGDADSIAARTIIEAAWPLIEEQILTTVNEVLELDGIEKRFVTPNMVEDTSGRRAYSGTARAASIYTEQDRKNIAEGREIVELLGINVEETARRVAAEEIAKTLLRFAERVSE